MTCSVGNCENRSKARGLCKFHWQRSRDGVPLDAPRGYRPPGRRYGRLPKSAAEKVRGRFGTPGECWEWTGSHTPQGYGIVNEMRDGARKWFYAHRVAYEAARGPIPDGLEIDHLCRNRGCFNPEHLEPVTHAENVRRAVR